MKTTPFFSRIRETIAAFSVRERAVFAIASLLLVVGAFGGLVALSNRATTLVPRFGGTYREGIVGSPRFINPVLAYSDADRDLSALVYSGLVRLSPDGTMIPDLAESWTISEDGKTYSFTLKPKLSFHDGKPLTANDVAFTVKSLQNPAFKSAARVSWAGVSTEVADERTITFTIEKPYAGFLAQLSVGIIPEHVWAGIPEDAWSTSEFNTEPVGSGPYRVKDVSRSRVGVPETFTLSAFRKFALGRPHIAEIVVTSFQNKDDAFAAFESGSVDGLSAVDSADAARVADSSSTLTTQAPRVFGLFLNGSKNSILADSSVTKALGLAIDKTAISDSVFAGFATPLSGPLPESTDLSESDYATRKALAEKTLDAAGWKKNTETGLREKDKKTLSFTLATAATPELQASAELVADQLAQVGIAANVQVFETGTLNDKVIRERDFEALLFGQVIRHDTDAYAFWHSSQKSYPGLNIVSYGSSRADALLENALKETDRAKRFGLYDSLSEELAKSAPVVFLYAPDFIYLTNKGARGIALPPLSAPSDRFASVYEWYLRTDRVWNLFLN